jgi:alpha-L-fucosidase 2
VRRWIKGSALAHGANFKVSTLFTRCNMYRERVSLAEWKVEKDRKTDTHRHLSHLIGLYPGYALASYDASLQGGLFVDGVRLNYTKDQVLDAAKISLIHRGDGTGPDGDTGWEKAWRAACWAQLGNATEFYHMLSVSRFFPRIEVF